MNLKRLERAYTVNKNPNTRTSTFITDYGIEYMIYAMPANRMIPEFDFSNQLIYIDFHPLIHRKINKIPNKKLEEVEKISDEKVINTVVNFILDIVKNKNSVIVFIASAEGGRRQERTKLFNIMYLRHLKNILHKMNYVFPVIGTCSMLFRRDNDYCASLCTVTDEQIIKNINDARQKRAR